MLAFPLYGTSYLVDVSNHYTIIDKLTNLDRTGTTWRVKHHEGGKWIEADDQSKVSTYLQEMVVAISNYPILDEHDYFGLEYPHVVKAVERKAEQSGTIIKHPHGEVVVACSDSDIAIIEDEPQRFTVMCDDATFKQLVHEIGCDTPCS